MHRKLVRAIISVLLILVMSLISFFLFLSAVFSGEGDFYSTVIIITFILLLIWLVLWSFKLLTPRKLYYSLGGIILCCAFVVAGYNLHRWYIDRIPVVGSEVDLTFYSPFASDTRAIMLNEPSLLKFTVSDTLPRIDGATALYPLYSAFVQAVYPEKEYQLFESEVSGGTTPVAYERLVKGEVDVIFCAAPSLSQIEKAREGGIEFKLTPIGREAFVFFVNKNNKIRNLTVDQIRRIYSGDITNWKEIGGSNDEIIAFQRPKNSGSQTMLEKIMGDMPIAESPKNRRVDGMGGIIRQTADYKNFNNAIGYTFLFYVKEMVGNKEIELLRINDITPDKNTIENGEYPFTGDFYAVTTHSGNKNVQRLIDWILSPQGQYLVEKTGYTSLQTTQTQ